MQITLELSAQARFWPIIVFAAAITVILRRSIDVICECCLQFTESDDAARKSRADRR